MLISLLECFYLILLFGCYHVNQVTATDCWWTGCQLDSWEHVGCSQYGRVEQATKSCKGGKEYHCCLITTHSPNLADLGGGKGCWWTGCQNKDWAVVGCDQYDMINVKTENCTNGKKYHCCPKSTQLSLVPTTATNASAVECWWTGCQKKDWAIVGCAQYNRNELDKRDCENGHEYYCCLSSTVVRDPVTTPLSKTTITLTPVQSGACWWTGCQKNDWAIVGCDQYNRISRESKECKDGKEYYCCPKNDIVDTKPLNTNISREFKPESEVFSCRWSVCQPKTWQKRGCPYDTELKTSEPCHEGDIFQCCKSKNSYKKEKDREHLTKKIYSDLVHSLLLKSRNVNVNLQKLKCTFLDPDKSIVIPIDPLHGVRMCDIYEDLPQIYLNNISLIQEPFNITLDVTFQECFIICTSISKCLTFTHNEIDKKKMCYMYNSTIGEFKNKPDYQTVLMTQPVQMLKNWLYVRHTVIKNVDCTVRNGTSSFLRCLQLCESSQGCVFVSYDLVFKECKMFTDSMGNNSLDMSYGWLTAFNILNLPDMTSDALDVSWRFVELEYSESKDSNVSIVTQDSCTKYRNETHSAYSFQMCKISRANGCDPETGCRFCYYPEKTKSKQNLPICKDSEVQKTFKKDEKVTKQMVSCLDNESCIGVGYDPSAENAELILVSEWNNFNKKYQSQYLLKYPNSFNGIHSFVTKNDFILDHDIFPIPMNDQTSLYIESVKDNLNECINEMNKNPKVKIVSYSQRNKKCKLANYRVSIVNSPGQGIITWIKHPTLEKYRAHFIASYGTGLDKTKASRWFRSCKSNCDEICAYRCANLYSAWCFSFSLTYNSEDSICHFYNKTTSGTARAILSKETVLFTRVSKQTFELESIDQVSPYQRYNTPFGLDKNRNRLDEIIESKKLQIDQKLRSKRFIPFIIAAIKGIELSVIVVPAIATFVTGVILVAHAENNLQKIKKDKLDDDEPPKIFIQPKPPSFIETIEFGVKKSLNELRNVKKCLFSLDCILNPIKNKYHEEDEETKQRCGILSGHKIIDETVKDCSSKSSCAYECQPGNHESPRRVWCKRKDSDRFEWTPKPLCESDSCARGDLNLITLDTPVAYVEDSSSPETYTVYRVLYDKSKKLPIWSISLLQNEVHFRNSLNLMFNVVRGNSFFKHPCMGLINKQGDYKMDYQGSGWNRGHLTPADIARWSPKSWRATNMYINVAPQEPWTNKVWGQLEAHVFCQSMRKQSLVVTGVCDHSIGNTRHNSLGLSVPACFWKMICYHDENHKEVVVGFISNNSDIPTDESKRARKQQMLTPVSQSEIKNLIAHLPEEFRSPWITAAYKLDSGRVGPDMNIESWFPVNPSKCEQANYLLDHVRENWITTFQNAEQCLLKDRKKKKRERTKREVVEIKCGCHPDDFKATLSMIALTKDNSAFIADPEDVDVSYGTDNGDGSVKVSVQNCGKRIVGYYRSWGERPITGQMLQRLTHVVYAFLEVEADGSIIVGSPDRKQSVNIHMEITKSKMRLQHLMSLASIYPHVKVLFAVGGWENSQYFSVIAANEMMRKNFIASVVQLIKEYGFDGVDIDWEYPVTGGANEGVPEDKNNYVTLMKDLRGVLDTLASESGRKEKYLISFAGAAGQWTLDPGYDLSGLLKYADFANIMTYDYFGAWGSKWGAYTGPPAPLFFGMPPGFSGKTNADYTVKYYACKSKLPHKLNMGVPFYGRYWKNVGDPVDGKDGMWRTASSVGGKFEGSDVPWYKIISEYSTSEGFTTIFHEKSKTPYAWNPNSKIFLGFENEESLGEKVKYAVDKNVGGLMIWAVDLDDDQLTLLDIISNANLCSNSDPHKIAHVCSPIDERRWWTPEDGEDKAGLCGKSAPLYKGYYPVCDPFDPGFSCCSKFGYCGSGPDFCDCPTCKDFGKDPGKIIEGAIKPSVPITWYLLNAPDGKRGRCGRTIEKINGVYPTCNPDDDNSHCCSNGGYCGATPEFCECSGCINFRKSPNYKYGPKKWWTLDDGAHLGGRCGPNAEKIDGYEAECDPDSPTHNCCSPHGWCGTGPDFCDCDGCKRYK